MGLETLAVLGEAVAKRKARLFLAGIKQQYAKIIAFETPKDGVKFSKGITSAFTAPGVKWELEAQFNPDSLSYDKVSNWKTTTIPFSSDGYKSFAGSMPGSFKLELLFDTSDVGESVFEAYIQFIEQLLEVTHTQDGKDPKPPPPCRFKWGSFITPLMVATKATIKYTMFLADGTPVRATANMEFEEYDDEALSKSSSQNPTSASYARKIWRVAPGETLDWIAFKEYGSPAHWRHIANTNNLRNPMDLKPGTILKLLPLA